MKFLPTNIQADCLISCPTCKMLRGKTCINTGKPKDKLKIGQSHIGRRIKRILILGKLPEERC